MKLKLTLIIILPTILLPVFNPFNQFAFCDDWPQWRGINRDGVWKENGIIDTFPSEHLTPLWKASVGPGYNGPTVAKGRVYVMDKQKQPEGERIFCFDINTGKQLWVYAYECDYEGLSYPLGPRASVTISNGLAFAIGAMGHFHCLDAATGKVLWKKDLDDEYKIRWIMWGMSSSPIIWENNVIVQFGGANGACVVAFDVKIGKEIWRAINDRASYSSPVIIEQAGKKVLLCWTQKYINALDPGSGKIYWKQPYRLARKAPRQNIATPIVEGKYLFLCSAFEGSQMFKLSHETLKAELMWHRGGWNGDEGGIDPSITTPLLKGGHIYSVDMRGEFYCLKAETGETLWKNDSVTPIERNSTVHIVQNENRTWIFNEAGELIIAELSPEGFRQISRAKIIEPTHKMGSRRVCWAHPAFANGCVFARNDRELICVSLRMK